MGVIYDIIMSIFEVIFNFIAAIEAIARRVMSQLHVNEQIQTIVLVGLGVMLVLWALRVFGGVITILVTAFVILFLLHLFEPSFTANFHPSDHQP